jgi:peptidoglycan/xylan/chitin deacetylase (PgdA/CDA1 family)
VAVGFASVRVTAGTGGCARAAWALGGRFTLPTALLERTTLCDRLSLAGELALPAESCGLTTADAEELRERAAFTETPPLSSRLPVSYQRVPPLLRGWLATIVGRRQRRRAARWAEFPAWPLDLSADFVADLAGLRRIDLGSTTPVLLTHDIDSPEGLANLAAAFVGLEEAVGARSTNYIVTNGWPLDHAVLGEIAARGHEIGVHGYDHSNRTPFADPGERRHRLDAAREIGDRYHALGYRAPSLLRTRALLRDLASRFQYDSSVPTSGGPFPVPNNGCATARPFLLEGILEIPLTLPRDGSLRFLGYGPEEILRLWIDCAETIAKSGGIVVLLTHCEARFSGSKAMFETYRRFVEYVSRRADRFRFTTPQRLLPTIERAVKEPMAIG